MNKKGFTLTELIGAIVVIAIIVSLATVSFVGIRRSILKKDYENLVSYLETKAANYAEETGELNVTVERLIETGYVDADDNNILYNPMDKTSMNCYIFDSTFEDENYKAKMAFDIGQDNTGKCNSYEVNKEIEICIYKNGECTNAFQDWYNTNIKMGVKIGNSTELASQANVVWRTGGETVNQPTYTTNIINVSKNTYTVDVRYDVVDPNNNQIVKHFEGSDTAAINIDLEKPIVNSIKIEKEHQWTNVNKKVTIKVSDNYGSGIAGIIVVDGNTDCSNVDSGWILLTEDTYVDEFNNGTYNVCVQDRAGNVSDNNYFEISKIDDSVPECVLEVAEPDGLDDWYLNSPTITIKIINDDGSDVLAFGLTKDENKYYNRVSSLKQDTDTTGQTFYGFVKDSAGNEGICTITVKVDTTDPTCTSSGDSTTWSNANRTINYGCNDATSTCNPTASGGSKVFNVTTKTSTIAAYTIKDKAGNETNCPARTANVYVDKTAPTCTNSGDSTTWTSGNRTINYSCNDTDSGCNTSYSGGSKTFSTTTKTSSIAAYTIKDKAGNSVNCPVRTANVYVDKTAPTCTNSGDSTTWTNANRTINYGCNDTDSGCNTSYSGGSKTFSTTTKTSSIAAYTIKDSVGNSTSCPARTANVYVDKTAPTCTNSGDSTTWTNANRTINYGCNDTNSGCLSTASGGSKTFNTTTKTSSIAAYTIKDVAGNSTSCPARTANVYVDKTAPTCTNSGDSTTWTASNRTINYGCSDTDSGCDSNASGGSKAFSTTTQTSSIAAYTIKDKAGNSTSCPARTANVYVDKTAPTCTNSGDSTTWTNANRTITYGCSDSNSGCDTAASGGSKAFSTTTKTASIAAYTIKDKVGNSTSCPARTANVYVDKTAPTCTNSGDSTTWTNGNRTINYGCSDANSGCNTSASGGSKSFTTTTQTSSIAAYTIKDNAGNSTSCPARTANVYVDKTAPTCTNSGDSTTWTNGNRTINYGCSDANSGCDTSASGGSKAFSTTTKTASIAAYTIKDKAGNSTSCAARTANVYVDKTAPTCTNSGDSTTWTNANRTITYGCSDANSGCKSGASGGSKAFSTTTKTSSIAAYTITDNAGNSTSCAARTANVYVDKTAPTCTNSGDSTTWTNGNRTINYGCSDANSGCKSGASGGSKAFSTTTKTSSIAAYTITDNAGNSTSCAARTANVYVDKTAPTCTNSGDSTTWTNANRTITYGCSDSHSGCKSGASGGSKAFSTTTKTSSIAAYTITDNAGNSTSCAARTANVYVDKTAPACTNSGDSTTWTASNRTITYGCSDANSGCKSGASGGSKAFSTTTKTSSIAAYTITDNAGNSTSCAARTANVYVDKTAPTCTNSGDSTTWTKSNRTITYGCSDAHSGCNASYSGGSTTYSTTTKTATIAAYTIKDAVGNTTSCAARTANVYVDKTAPTYNGKD